MNTLKITSLNANGIRSAASKGLENWLARTAPDVLCVQELKAQLPDIEKEKLKILFVFHKETTLYLNPKTEEMYLDLEFMNE